MKRYLTTKEAGDWLGVCEATIRKYTKRGLLDCKRDFNGYRRIPVQAVKKFEIENLKRIKL